jgi:hypothetical protein
MVYDNYKYMKYLANEDNIIVIGSTEPWVEALVLAANASFVTTLDYNPLTYQHKQMATVSAKDFDRLYQCHGNMSSTVMVAFSMSSFDHDGLGRYGDPLSPFADIFAMRRLHDLMTPEGIFFLSVPIGPDVVVFNLQRRYGEVRLPLFLQGWIILDIIGWDANMLTKLVSWRNTYEPIFILRKDSSFKDTPCKAEGELRYALSPQQRSDFIRLLHCMNDQSSESCHQLHRSERSEL